MADPFIGLMFNRLCQTMSLLTEVKFFDWKNRADGVVGRFLFGINGIKMVQTQVMACRQRTGGEWWQQWNNRQIWNERSPPCHYMKMTGTLRLRFTQMDHQIGSHKKMNGLTLGRVQCEVFISRFQYIKYLFCAFCRVTWYLAFVNRHNTRWTHRWKRSVIYKRKWIEMCSTHKVQMSHVTTE